MPDVRAASGPADLHEQRAFVRKHRVVGRGEEMHMINADWLQRWQDYIEKGAEEGTHPGPISNWELLDADFHYEMPRQGLVAGQQYQAVSRVVWNFFQSHYGGGPDITNTTFDIYSASIHENATRFAPLAQDPKVDL